MTPEYVRRAFPELVARNNRWRVVVREARKTVEGRKRLSDATSWVLNKLFKQVYGAKVEQLVWFESHPLLRNIPKTTARFA